MDPRQAFTRMQAAGILMRARGDRLSVASRAPLTDQQRVWIRAHKVELLRLLTEAVPCPAELKGEDREAIEERATFRTLDGGASRKATVERPPSSMRVYRYGLLDKPDTWLTMIALLLALTGGILLTCKGTEHTTSSPAIQEHALITCSSSPQVLHIKISFSFISIQFAIM